MKKKTGECYFLDSAGNICLAESFIDGSVISTEARVSIDATDETRAKAEINNTIYEEQQIEQQLGDMQQTQQQPTHNR